MANSFDFYRRSSQIKAIDVKNGINIPLGLRKARFSLMTSTRAQRHEDSSPFLEIYNAITLRSLDHGLFHRFTHEEYVNSYGYDYDKNDYDEIHIEYYFYSYRLLFVFILCHMFAICVFIVEVINHKYFVINSMYFANIVITNLIQFGIIVNEN